MTKEQLNQLERIYNTFCLINTKGEDTIIMGQALNAFKIILQQIAAVGLEDPLDRVPAEEKE